MEKWENDVVIQRLREYLRIPSVHPDPDYGDCVTFLQKQAEELGLPSAVHELVPKKPLVVVTWLGTHPHLPAILLNSHMDVVPVYEKLWTYPPFSAQISEDGWIYARGTQDIKGLGMLYLEAIRRMKDAGVRLRRTVHVSFSPDEEIGGKDGMGVFSESEMFRNLNIGFELDEGGPSSKSDEILAFHGERTAHSMKVTCRGTPCHGALLPDNTAGEKLYYMIEKFLQFRAEQKHKMEKGSPLGSVTTVNLTMLEGGVEVNVLPGSLSATFDVRVSPSMSCEEFDRMVKSWCKEAGDGVTSEYVHINEEIPSTNIDEIPFWHALKKSLNDSGFKINAEICPGATDARYVRKQGIPAIGLTPFVNTPLLVHGNDERLHVEEYKKRIHLMEKVLEAVANVQ